MPFIHIKIAASGPASFDAKATLHRRTTELMATVMRKNAQLTSVLIEEHLIQNWRIGDRPIAESGIAAAHMDIKVTAGTNTDREKAKMIADSMAMFCEVFGLMPEATYVVIDEVPAESWGYGGHTQAAHRVSTAA